MPSNSALVKDSLKSQSSIKYSQLHSDSVLAERMTLYFSIASNNLSIAFFDS